MYKHISSFLLIIAVPLLTLAQRGNNQVKILAELGIPAGHYNLGYGGFIKGLYGVGAAGQLTLTTGVSRFTSDRRNDISGSTVRLIPFLAGYRHHFKKFYIEPQAGYGEFGGKITINGDYARPSVAAFFWSAAAGLDFKKLDVGIRYQGAQGAQGTSAGTWHDGNFRYTGIYIGINLF